MGFIELMKENVTIPVERKREMESKTKYCRGAFFRFQGSETGLGVSIRNYDILICDWLANLIRFWFNLIKVGDV